MPNNSRPDRFRSGRHYSRSRWVAASTMVTRSKARWSFRLCQSPPAAVPALDVLVATLSGRAEIESAGGGHRRLNIRSYRTTNEDLWRVFPRTATAFEAMFSNEEACMRSLVEVSHHRVNLRQLDTKNEDPLHQCHRVANLLKRWFLGTYHGSASRKHLAA